MQTATQSSIATIHDAKHPKNFGPLVKALLEHFSANTLDDQNKDRSSQTMPLIDIAKYLAEIYSGTLHGIQTPQDSMEQQAPPYPPLERVSKPNVTTAEITYYTNQAEQTWRTHACHETFPAGLRPLRIGGRLNWPTKGLKKLLGVA